MTTFEKIADIISEHADIDKAEIKQDSTIEQLGLDSLDVVEITMQIEDDFGVSFGDDASFETIGELCSAVDELSK